MLMQTVSLLIKMNHQENGDFFDLYLKKQPMRTFLSAIFLFCVFCLQAQTYNSVKIDLTEKPIIELAKLGLDVEHGEFASGKHFIGVFSDRELMKIEQAGFAYEILIENLSDYRRTCYHNHHGDQGIATMRNPGPCDDPDASELEVPDNFELGSFLGFFTYQEMLDNLDAMAAQYPDLITVKAPIDGFLTHEDRPIYWIKISDNVNTDEAEPEVLYTAVHHAREPGGMSGLIYFMWHVLENYDSDPQIQAMVNETELYLIPCLNPDGYIFNEENYLNGGDIYWRKNRRDNGDGTFGVDLNRNYGYEFGYNNSGSSPNPNAATYRGPSAFSEPETDACRAFCNDHEFQIALNYHTFGNLLIYPWGYDDIGTADQAFINIANGMVAQNEFFAGTAIETVGYAANGNSDDWMYGEDVTKPAIYSLTPELGLGGFYPDVDQIIPIVQSALDQNIVTGALANSFAQFEEQNDFIISSINTMEFNYQIRNIGLMDGDFTVSLEGISDNFDAVDGAKNYNLDSQAEVQDFINYNLDNGVQAGEEIVFVLSVDNGDYALRDTITKVFGITEVILSDAGDNMDNWSAEDWGVTAEDFVSMSTSITDSPNGDYSPNTNNEMISQTISLVDVEGAYLNFWAKWEIENFYDFAQVSISTDGGNTFEAQCGQYTNAGSQIQDLNEPVYDGTQLEWVKESIDLSSYLGEEIIIQFRMVSDGGLQLDGFYIDDLEVIKLLDNSVAVEDIRLSNLQVRAYPNPVEEAIFLELNQRIADANLIFYNAQGTKVYEKSFAEESIMKVPVNAWASGMYFYEFVETNSGLKTTGKVLVK